MEILSGKTLTWKVSRKNWTWQHCFLLFIGVRFLQRNIKLTRGAEKKQKNSIYRGKTKFTLKIIETALDVVELFIVTIKNHPEKKYGVFLQIRELWTNKKTHYDTGLFHFCAQIWKGFKFCHFRKQPFHFLFLLDFQIYYGLETFRRLHTDEIRKQIIQFQTTESLVVLEYFAFFRSQLPWVVPEQERKHFLWVVRSSQNLGFACCF